ncbi:MAG: recombinase family protein [Hominisplanchenecus sp.]|nr:recombinase family protein [Hominisplanchenecus sp.]
MRKNDDCIAIYSRKSRFTGKGESIGNQVELCKEYIRTHYGEDTLDRIAVYEDEGFSGGNLNRPDFKNMMEAARKHKFKAIIVYRLDRISRNISDFSSLIEELSRLDIAFVSIKEQFDTGTPMGRAMMYIASVFSQLERETIAERIRDNMHELAKTGRWLGGTTPTGYGSESVAGVTIDGKSKKACKLKLIPEEAEIVKTIFDLYIETDSQTITEAELIKRGIRTKNNKYFTRFSIKAILQNPVYMIADEEAYHYFINADSDLFYNREAFDGVHGIMAYNRTSQEKGKTTEFLPPSEWIVAVGLHPGIIPGKVWVQVQESLERNKSKAYHKPRSNEALLTGFLYCSCGSRMYPKISRRRTADGKPIYTYVCKMKERSRQAMCNSKNVNGNIMDMAITTQIKMLAEDQDTFISQLEQSRKFYTGNRANYEKQLVSMRQKKADLEKKMDGLADSLVDLGDSVARNYVVKRMEQLGLECAGIDARIQELECLTSQHALSELEFDVMRQLLSVFKSGIDEMTIEQKRAAIRTIVRKVVWDGVNAHVILYGVQEDDREDDLKSLPGEASADTLPDPDTACSCS